jgi:ComEC/Rec2-related protein
MHAAEGRPLVGTGGVTIKRAELIGRVLSDPIRRNNRFEFTVETDSIVFRSSVARPDARVLVRLYDTSEPQLPRRGDHISIPGTIASPNVPAAPWQFNYRAWLRSHGVELTLGAWRSESMYLFTRDDLSPLEQLVESVRRHVRWFASEFVGGEQGDILVALMLGERQLIDEQTREQFRLTGTVHLLAVSGLHVGLIALALFVGVSWIRSRGLQLVIFASMLGLYVVVAGAGPSIVRAALMAVLFLGARYLGRISRPLNTIGVAALVLLLLNPTDLFDVGFQLSFASVLGIILAFSPMYQWITDRLPSVHRRWYLRHLVQMLLLSFCAQLFTLPLVLVHFGYVPIVSLLVNVPVIPLISIGLGAGIAGAVAAAFGTVVASWFGASVMLATGAAQQIIAWGSTLAFTGLDVGSIDSIAAALLGTGLLYLVLSRNAAQVVLRSMSVIIGMACILTLRIEGDPLRKDGVLYLMPMPSGTALAFVEHDTLRMYTARASDSAAAAYQVEALRRRLGIQSTGVRSIDSTQPQQMNALLINREPSELALRSHPVILSETAQRPLGLVRVGSEQLLQVPMRMQLTAAIVVSHRNHWSMVLP